ncbi:hypothetical protein LCGC14_2987470 [marine sediment metagenome]|uniref:Uncharacterized protein n=1 Tax=marine sediment metagenome TaxID=412755 RepID=A0A0F8XSC8_9ZZZZ
MNELKQIDGILRSFLHKIVGPIKTYLIYFLLLYSVGGTVAAVLFYKGTKISLASFTAEKAQHEKNLRALRQSKTTLLSEIKQLATKQKKIDAKAEVLQADYISITNTKTDTNWKRSIYKYR